MKCSDYNELMMKYFDHNTDKAEAEKLFKHINDCPNCSSIFHDMKNIFETIETAPVIECESDFEDRVMKAVVLEVYSRNQTGKMFLNALYGSLAIIAILTVSSVAINFSGSNIFEVLSGIINNFYVFNEIAGYFQFMYNIILFFFSDFLVLAKNVLLWVFVVGLLGISFMFIKKILDSHFFINSEHNG